MNWFEDMLTNLISIVVFIAILMLSTGVLIFAIKWVLRLLGVI